MIFIIGHIIFGIFGLIIFVRGVVSLSKDTEVVGFHARMIGLLAMLTYPIAWVIGFCWGRFGGAYHQGEASIEAALFVNLGAFVISGIGIFITTRMAQRWSK